MLGFRHILRQCTYRWRYPSCRIEASAFVQRATVLGSGVSIHENSSVVASTVGAKSTIGASCRVLNSQMGERTCLAANVRLFNSSMGRFSFSAEETWISNVSIGSFTSIGPRCIIGYGDHPSNWGTSSPVLYAAINPARVSWATESLFLERKDILIGSDVWIGAQVFIRDGVAIGHGAVVGAGAVVVKDVPPYAIVGGVPAQIIKLRFDEPTVEAFLDLAWWDWPEEEIRAARRLLAAEPSVGLVSDLRQARQCFVGPEGATRDERPVAG